MVQVTSPTSHARSYPTIERVAKRLKLLASDYIFIWPKALFYHTPLIFKDIRVIRSAVYLMKPQVQQISHLSQRIFGRTDVSINQFRRVKLFFSKLAEKADGLDPVTVASKLQEHKEKISTISKFFSDVLSKMPASGSVDDPDAIAEMAVTIKLLTALIDDLSSRTGLFSEGKPRLSSDAIVADAQAVSVPESKERESSLDLEALIQASDADALVDLEIEREKVVNQDSHQKRVYVQKIRHRRFVVPEMKKELIDDEAFLRQFDHLIDKDPEGLLALMAQVCLFIVKDVILGIPQFLLFDLPQLIKNLQLALRKVLSEMKMYASFTIQIKDLLKETDDLLHALGGLENVFEGIELFMHAQDGDSISSMSKGTTDLLDFLHGFVESTDSSHIVAMMTDMKSMISKVNPTLKKILDALHGKSLISLMFTRNRAASSHEAPSVAAAAASPGRSSAVSAESELTEEALRTDPYAAIKGFMKKIGKGVQEIAKTPRSFEPPKKGGK